MPEFEPKIIAFFCQYCPDKGVSAACGANFCFPSNIKRIGVPCAGRVDILHLLHAFEAGADAVFVLGCMEGDCHNEDGNVKALKRVTYVKKVLEDLGIKPERVEMFHLNSSKASDVRGIGQEMIEKTRELGPSPVRTS